MLDGCGAPEPVMAPFEYKHGHTSKHEYIWTEVEFCLEIKDNAS